MTESSTRSDSLTAARSAARTSGPARTDVLAPELAVAQVAVDVPFAHLDRPFDYAVPAAMHEAAVPGCRVKVRFAGRELGGFLLERGNVSDHGGQLTPLRRVVSSEPVLHPQVRAVARMVADRYAGTLADVLRAAVPPRHARVEKAAAERLQVDGTDDAAPDDPRPVAEDLWEAEVGGQALTSRLAAGQSPRAVWTALADAEWPNQLAAAAAATLESGRGSVLCLPDVHDVNRVAGALRTLLRPVSFVVLTSELGPAARYRSFLAASRGEVQIVVGTRAAAFAPVRHLGLVAIWDDGDDLYAEPRAPYHHAREVLLLRAHHERAGTLLGGFSCSVEAQALLETGWAVHLSASRERMRAASPVVHITGESDSEPGRDPAATAARMPRRVFEVVREALQTGPVLVHSPRYGYQPALSCSRCWAPARCEVCTGPLSRTSRAAELTCRWCAAVPAPWRCARCGGVALRAPVVGALRTAQEWGRSFPKTSVVTSGGAQVVSVLDDERGIVIATPGAEPQAAAGYAAAVLLDTSLTLSRPGMRTEEEALRRWLNVAALVRPADSGGQIIAVGDPHSRALQALVRWDPVGFAVRGLAERRSAQLPPAFRLATVTASPEVLTDALAALQLPSSAELLGPVELEDGDARAVIRSPRARGVPLSRALQHLQAARSARKLMPVRVQVDPAEVL